MRTNSQINDLRSMFCPCKIKDEVELVEINEEYVEYDGFQFIAKPLNAIIELTNKCNLRCKHCCITEKRNEKGINISILNELINLGIENFELTGGEPLLHPHFKEILQLLIENNCYFRIMSNGYFWSNELYELLQCYPNVEIFISIDGNEEIHDSIRGKGSFVKAINTIREVKIHDIKLGISMAVSKINIDCIDYLSRLVKEQNIDIIKLIPLKSKTLDPEFIDMYSLSFEDFQRIDSVIEKINLPNKLEYNDSHNYNSDKRVAFFGCKMGGAFCSIDSYGYLQNCPVTRAPVGQIDDGNFIELWNILQINIRRELYSSKCYDCYLRKYCAGNCSYA
ncbi:MAG: radical SAM protein [Candidatus Krumholzibacteriota bacterium]|nr:radical SAM protein [Candidatus Krumholzibacteriota bacterium]